MKFKPPITSVVVSSLSNAKTAKCLADEACYQLVTDIFCPNDWCYLIDNEGNVIYLRVIDV